MRPHSALVFVLVGGVLIGAPVRAEVVDSQPFGFTVRDSVEVAASPERVWRALGDIGHWWDPAHTYSHDARNLSLTLRPGGCWCEILPSGGGVVHMTVVFVKPGEALRTVGALGPLQADGAVGSMTWTLKPDGDHTRLTMTYDVGGHANGGLAALAAPVDAVLAEQVARLKAYAEAAKP